jgi:hypothetical protein
MVINRINNRYPPSWSGVIVVCKNGWLMMGQSKRLIATLKGKKKNPLIWCTTQSLIEPIIGMVNNMNSQSHQWCQYLPNDFYYFGNSNTPPIQNILWFFLLHYAQLVRFCIRLHCPSNPMILPQVQSFSCPSCARLFARWRGLTHHHQSNGLPFNSIPHSINLVHKHVALLFLSPFIIPISSSSSSSSYVIRLTIRLLLNCLSWVCQFNLALCNMSFIQFHFWSFIRSATYCSFDGGDIFPWYGILTPLFKHCFLPSFKFVKLEHAIINSLHLYHQRGLGLGRREKSGMA